MDSTGVPADRTPQSPLRVPRLASEGGDPRSSSAESILETPTYSIVLVLLAFQVLTILFTVVVKSIQHLLRSRRRLGLLDAVNHSVHELTLLGFVSIILLTLEERISDICVDAAYFRADWTILRFVYGEGYCPCCLENTKSVQKCVLEYASCGDSFVEGDEFCNCDGADPTCVYPKEGTAVPPEEQVCNGPVALDGQDQCGEGKVRAVSILALEQVHYLIFLLSIVHVLCGFVLYGLAWLRVRWEWGRWEKQRDVHHEKVSEVLKDYYKDLEKTLQRHSMGRGHGRSKSEGDGFKDNEPSLMSCPSRIGDDDGAEEAGGSGANRTDEEAQGASEQGEKRVRRVTVAFADDGSIDQDSSIQQRPVLERCSATLPKVLGKEDLPPNLGLRRSLTRAKSFQNLAAMERKLRHGALYIMNRWSRVAWRFTKDKSHSLLQGAGPLLVSQSQYYKLRASFVYTHKLGGTFNFLSHVMSSMVRAVTRFLARSICRPPAHSSARCPVRQEDDLAHLVGITPFFWIITMLFWLISGVMGYAVMPFFALTAILMVVLNAKLVDIVKGIVSKMGTGHALILDESIFWYRWVLIDRG